MVVEMVTGRLLRDYGTVKSKKEKQLKNRKKKKVD